MSAGPVKELFTVSDSFLRPTLPSTVEQEIRLKITKVQETTDLLPLLEDPHTEYVLLKSCLSLPKLSFLLRTVGTSEYVELLRR